MKMKIYRLADVDFRGKVDLTDYELEITRSVEAVVPEATVTVLKDGFYASVLLSKSQVIQISRELRKGSLRKYTMYRPCLFNGYSIVERHPKEKEEDKDGRKGNAVDRRGGDSKELPPAKQKKDQGNPEGTPGRYKDGSKNVGRKTAIGRIPKK